MRFSPLISFAAWYNLLIPSGEKLVRKEIMARKNTNKLCKMIAVLVLLIVASSAFAGSVSDTTVLRLRGYVAPQASFSANADGQLSVAANNDAFQFSVLDRNGQAVEIEDGRIAADAGQMTFSVMAV